MIAVRAGSIVDCGSVDEASGAVGIMANVHPKKRSISLSAERLIFLFCFILFVVIYMCAPKSVGERRKDSVRLEDKKEKEKQM